MSDTIRVIILTTNEADCVAQLVMCDLAHNF